jgi:hypothetical protein
MEQVVLDCVWQSMDSDTLSVLPLRFTDTAVHTVLSNTLIEQCQNHGQNKSPPRSSNALPT